MPHFEFSETVLICPAQRKFLISMCLEARRHGRIYVAVVFKKKGNGTVLK
jgi:hypothetical protein